MNKNLQSVVIIALVSIGLDFLLHYFFTSPMESFEYFMVKLILVLVVAFFMFKKNVDVKRALWFAAIFVVLFGIYYRLTEVLEGNGWLSRVPDIHLGALNITSTNPFMSALVWGLFHGSFFMIGYFISREVK